MEVLRLIAGILLIFTTAAVWMDLSYEKIHNRLIILGWIMGFSYQFIQHGIRGIGIYLLGSIMPILPLYLLFYFRMLGAGDIKLLSVIGGFLGPKAATICVGVSFVFGAVLSLGILILCGNLMSRLRYFAEYFIYLQKNKKVVPYRRKGQRMEHMHFSVAILMGVLLHIGGFY